MFIFAQRNQTNYNMKTYTIDYTKVSQAENCLYTVQTLLANDSQTRVSTAALSKIEEARYLLQEFLNQDNLIEDDDLADGLVRQSEVETLLDEKQSDTIWLSEEEKKELARSAQDFSSYVKTTPQYKKWVQNFQEKKNQNT